MKFIMTMLCLTLGTGLAHGQDDAILLQFYDVRDLCAGTKPLTGPDAAKEEVRRRDVRLEAVKKLLEWNLELAEKTTIDMQKSGLVVRAPKADHDEIRNFLSDLRSSMDRFQVTVTFVTVPTDFKVGEAEAALGGSPYTLSLVDTKEAMRIREAGTVMDTPPMEATTLQDCSVLIAKTRKYVTRWERIPGVEGHPRGVVVPTIEEVTEGIEIDSFVVPSRDGRFLTLDLELTLRGLSRPPVEKRGELGTFHDITPATQKVSSSVTLPDGGVIAVSGLRPIFAGEGMESGKSTVALIKVARS